MLQELSPAKKAWITRRLLAEQRAKVEVAKVAIAAAPPKSNPLNAVVIEINLDRADVGSGWRRWIVLSAGAAWVRLFNASTLQSIDVRRAVFDKGARVAKFNRDNLAAIIKRNVALADRVNGREQKIIISDGGADAVAALGRIA
jgi:hypothetical protein